MVTGTYFPISQFPKRRQPRWASTIWEIGKLGSGWRYILPNFPNSQFPKRPQPMWLSTIWEIGKWLQVHTSQFPNFPNDPSPSGLALFGKLRNGKWLEVHTSQFPNFPKDLSPSGSALFGKFGNWEMITGTYFPISQIIPAQMGQHDLGNWEIAKPKP